MEKKRDSCVACGDVLETKENDVSVLLICANSECSNYWIDEGSEIIMLLK